MVLGNLMNNTSLTQQDNYYKDSKFGIGFIGALAGAAVGASLAIVLSETSSRKRFFEQVKKLRLQALDLIDKVSDEKAESKLENIN